MEDNIYIYEVPYWKKKKEYVNQDIDVYLLLNLYLNIITKC